MHELIVGGNYMVLSQSGRALKCTLCNASHGVITSQSLPAMPGLPPYTSDHQGC